MVCMRTRLSLLLVALFTNACIATTDSSVDNSSDGDQVTRTVVHLNDNGTQTVTQQTITVVEQQAELARNQRLEEEYLSQPKGVAYATDPPVTDPGCSWYSLKLFDGTGYTGNYICLTGSGYANLSSYCRTMSCAGRLCVCSGWNGAVRSYWSGSNTGWYDTGTSECPPADSMPAYEARSTVSSCVQSARNVVMNYFKL